LRTSSTGEPRSGTGRSRGLRAALLIVVALFAVAACGDLLGIHGDRPLESDGGEGLDSSTLPDGPPFDSDEAHQRADDALASMLLHYWNATYLDETRGTIALPGSYAHAWQAVADGAARHHDGRFAGTVRTFYEAQGKVGWSFHSFDDASRMVLALLATYEVTGEAAHLAQARSVYQDVMSQWDTTCCASVRTGLPGGIWHDREHLRKSTAVNAHAIIAGARLYARTNISAYLSFAQQVYEYWSASMVDPATHQVMDSVDPWAVDAHEYTYDQGLMIGAVLALARVTGDTSSIERAHEYARFMLAEEVAPSTAGDVLSDGNAASCPGVCAQSKGLAARYLAELYGMDRSHGEYLALLARSATAVWTIARDPSNQFGTDWTVFPTGARTVDAHVSAVMALAALASVGPPPPRTSEVAIETEEATLHRVLLEAGYPGYSGWGYVSAWGCPSSPAQEPQLCKASAIDGQGVDLRMSAPMDGVYDLTFRYSAIADNRDGVHPNSVRALSVNGGSPAVDAVPFSATQDWAIWTTKTLTEIPLHAGLNRLSLTFDSTRGSYGWMNLDRMLVSDCPTRADGNLLPTQPTPASWDGSFERRPILAVVGQICNEPAVQWREPRVSTQSVLRFNPLDPPVNLKLPAGQYVATMVMRGKGTYRISVWDGVIGDQFGTPGSLTEVPQTLSVAFQRTDDPRFQMQIRIAVPAPVVDVDTTFWHVAIRPQ
jgi:predicted alpha-1,6-mannanase (GH76 family)